MPNSGRPAARRAERPTGREARTAGAVAGALRYPWELEELRGANLHGAPISTPPGPGMYLIRQKITLERFENVRLHQIENEKR